jgi:anti-anti-sigma factor
MLKVDVQTFDRSVQLKITGRLVHGDESDLLIQTVDIRTEPSILIDLSELESVDAAGLGTLVFLQHQLELEGRELVLLSPPEYLLSLLRLTGLEGVLTVRESCPA